MQVGVKTHIGLVREKNEDSFFAEAPLFAVADGVGGANAGEIASHEALDVFRKAFAGRLRFDEDVMTAAMDAALEANRHLFRMAGEKKALAGMGTTLTVFYAGSGKGVLLQVGDSRLYRLRDGELVQISEDQTLVAQLVATGKITPAEAKVHPRKSWLLQALGTEDDVKPVVTELELEPDDRFLICTDGLSNMVSDTEIAECLKNGSVEECADRLVERALANGGRDNITVIVLADVCKEE